MDTLLGLIGNTPIIRIEKLPILRDREVYVKLEYFNPTGSHKDRIALHMLKDAADRSAPWHLKGEI